MRWPDLLDVLKITKQSLARVLKQLVDEGWIAQQAGVDDRRERRLRVTEKGAGLARRLDLLQAKRVARCACEACGPGNEGRSCSSFLFSMISPEERGSSGGAAAGPIGAAAAARGLKPEPHCTGDAHGTVPDNAPHILVVDDDQRIRDLLARYLYENGFRVPQPPMPPPRAPPCAGWLSTSSFSTS